MRRLIQHILAGWLKALHPRPRFPSPVSFLLLVLLFSGLPIDHSYAQVPNEDNRRILILHSYHPDYPWTDEIDEGIHNAIDQSGLVVDVFTEYMDMKRHVPEPLYPYLRELYSAKYGDLQPDVIICSDDSAFDFLTEARSDLFPGVPVVFCGISDLDLASSFQGTGITGVIEDFDLRGTLDLALEIQPDTKHVAVISDSSPTGISHSAVFRDIAPQFLDRLDYFYLNDLTADELAGSCTELPENTIIIVLSYFIDHEGNFYRFGEAAEIIGQSCDYAIYTAWDFLVGYGAIGGMVTSGMLQGEAATNLALRILGGESADDIPIVTESPKLVMLDYDVFKRFGMRVPDISRDQIVVNEPNSFYYKHKPLVWFVFIFIAFEALAIFLLFMNIRIRRNMEIALRESEERYRNIVDNSPLPILLHRNGVFIFANSAAVELHGAKSVDQIVGKGIDDFLHPDYVDTMKERLKQISSSPEKVRHLSLKIVRLDGQVIDLDTTSLTFDYQGKPAHFVICTDMTERNRVLEALRQSEARYRELFDYAGDAILVRDMEGKILDVNKVACERLGYSREEFLNLSLADILTPEFAQLIPQRTMVLQAQRQAFFEAVFLAREGFRIPVELSSKLIDYSGREAILTIARDIIDRKRAEEEIRRKNEELEAALKVKTEFLSMVSHELRTPLVPIIGYSEVLLDGSMGELPEDARKSVQTILNRSNDLAKLIEDLLVLSRFERGSLKLEIEPLPVLQHISEILMDYRSRELKKDVTFTVEGPDIRVNADHTRLHQIITNLIDNAVKYSHDSVKIRIVTATRDDMGLISVEDNGIGIQEEFIPNIFDRFFQVEAVDTRSRGGAGLGLAIIKDLAESMGGRITVKSEFGVGSTFTVELPLSKP